MTSQQALDAMFRYPIGAPIKVKQQSDGKTLVVHVVNRWVLQERDRIIRRYTLAGHGGSVMHDAELVESAPQ